ncbi:UNKNOWN [Stylonychia lemnae]|uniref:Uncharacterized protein n=1 Tax=Stylonychia lemnae TaxID=5949 RepID=A0A078AP79_STYLE|nr:UNKNOWN [Stylonychia lemnae]|eukprot:CDW83741.1 UNKNOWN [Stylonychia lemnae]
MKQDQKLIKEAILLEYVERNEKYIFDPYWYQQQEQKKQRRQTRYKMLLKQQDPLSARLNNRLLSFSELQAPAQQIIEQEKLDSSEYKVSLNSLEKQLSHKSPRRELSDTTQDRRELKQTMIKLTKIKKSKRNQPAFTQNKRKQQLSLKSSEHKKLRPMLDIYQNDYGQSH